MGNVLDCSSDPLDQIHEGSDGDAPTEHIAAGEGRQGATSRSNERGEEGTMVARKEKSRRSVLYLEKAVPLRDSIMWKLQREYYTAHHVQCWERMVVPCFVTSNSFIARAYARILVGFMRDWFLYMGEADQSKPILIMEVGTGHGKFTYLVLKHLLEMAEFLPTLSKSRRASSTPRQPSKSQTKQFQDVAKGDSRHRVPADAEGLDRKKSGAETHADEPAQGEHPSQHRGQSMGKQEDSVNDKIEGEIQWDGRAVGEFDDLPFRYIATDIAQGTLDFLRSHPSMQSFLDTGLLELAVLDAEDPNPPSKLHLQVSGTTVDLKEQKAPMVVVCNYVFDSLKQDAFRVQGGVLYENRVSITAARPLPEDLSNVALNALEGLALQWEHTQHAVSGDRAKSYYSSVENGRMTTTLEHRYMDKKHGGNEQSSSSYGEASAREIGSPGGKRLAGNGREISPAVKQGIEDLPETDVRSGAGGTKEAVGVGELETVGSWSRGGSDADFDEVLASYLEESSGREGASLIVPLGGLRLLRHLSSLSGGRCVILAGDKGYLRADEMVGQREPHIAYHGSLSCMVNLDALSRYTQQRQGWVLSSPYVEGFKCQMMAFGMGKKSLEETRLAFEDATQEFGPESFSTLQRAVKDEVTQPSLWLVVHLLRLSQLDPDVFMKFRTSLVEQVSNHELTPSCWEDVRNDALAIADKWYPLQQGKDVNFEVGRLLMALKDFQSALILFRRSFSVCGEHHVTFHNMGVSYFHLGQLKHAKACFERCLSLNETYEDAVQWLALVMQAVAPSSGDVTPRATTTTRLDNTTRPQRLTSVDQPPVIIDSVGIPLGPLSI